MRKLRKSEINRIIKENSVLSNEELLEKYFDVIFNDVLGSQAERMVEVGWEESDIRANGKNMKTIWMVIRIFSKECCTNVESIRGEKYAKETKEKCE